MLPASSVLHIKIAILLLAREDKEAECIHWAWRNLGLEASSPFGNVQLLMLLIHNVAFNLLLLLSLVRLPHTTEAARRRIGHVLLRTDSLELRLLALGPLPPAMQQRISNGRDVWAEAGL